MEVSVTLQVPSSVYRLAKRTAAATSRPLEKVLADVITKASPVQDDLPSELQTEFDAYAQLHDRELWKIARSIFPKNHCREYDALLEKNSAGSLTQEERNRLHELRQESERLMVRKAFAYAMLKWRGHILPALAEIPGQQ